MAYNTNKNKLVLRRKKAKNMAFLVDPENTCTFTPLHLHDEDEKNTMKPVFN